MTIEHIVPKSKFPEGKWDIRNFTILCASCNSKKGAQHAPFHYAPASMVAAPAKEWAERGLSPAQKPVQSMFQQVNSYIGEAFKGVRGK